MNSDKKLSILISLRDQVVHELLYDVDKKDIGTIHELCKQEVELTNSIERMENNM